MIIRLLAALITGALLGWQIEQIGESGDALEENLRQSALIGASCMTAGTVLIAWPGRHLAWLRRWPTAASALAGALIYSALVFVPADVAFARFASRSPLVQVMSGLVVGEVIFGLPALVVMQTIVSIGPGVRWLAGGLPPGRHPAVEERLADREDLSPERMRDEHFPACDVAEVRSLMALFQDEGFPAGRFRPDDDLERVLEPEPAWNPLRWWLTRPAYEDAIGEIDYRLRRRGIMRLKSTTFRDVVQAWADAVKAEA